MATFNKDFIVKNGLIVQSSNSSTITTSAASSIGLIIKGVASQSGNLQEWQNNSGSTLTRVTSSGTIQAPTLNLQTTGLGGILNVNTAATSNIGVIVRGVASQSANLQEWQDSAAATILSVSPTADLVSAGNRSARFSYFQNVGGTGAYLDYATVSNTATILQRVTTAVGLIVRGAASQTADLIQAQNSAGSVVFKVSPTGVINAGGATTIGNVLNFSDPGIAVETRFNFLRATDSAWLAINEMSSDSTYYEFGMADNPSGGDYFQWRFDNWEGPAYGWMPLQMSGYLNRFTAASNTMYGNFALPYNTPYANINNAAFNAATINVNKYTPTQNTSQALFKDAGTGTGTVTLNAQSFTGSARTQYWIEIETGATTFKWGNGVAGATPVATGVVITGSAQTLNNGVTVTISTTGHVVGDRWSFVSNPRNTVAIGGTPVTGAMQIVYPAAGVIGSVIRGASGQTSNLQEWQDSASTVLGSIDPDGKAYFSYSSTNTGAFGVEGNLRLRNRSATNNNYSLIEAESSGGGISSGIQFITSDHTNSYGRMIFGTRSAAGFNSSAFTVESGGGITSTLNTASVVGLIIKGATSQSADLQQWQNTGGTALAKVDASGNLTAASFVRTSGISSQFLKADGSVDSSTYLTTGTASSTYAPINNPTFTGSVTLPGAPSSALQAATKAYVDSVAEGLHIHQSVVAATTAGLTATYANGTDGVGATLTNSGTLAAFAVDGVSPAQNDRILVKNQSTTFQNGIYTLTTVGSGSVAWVLTRAADFDTAAEMDGGDFVFVTAGTVGDNTGWVQTETVVTVGTSPILFTQFSGAGTYTAGDGLSLTSNQFAVDSTVVRTSGNQTIAGDKTFSGNVNIGGILDLTNAGVISALDMSNNTIANVNRIDFADPGPSEGLAWTGGNFALFESPNDLTTNTAGNLQIVTGTIGAYTRRMTVNSSGQVEIPVATGTAPLVIASTTAVTNLNADLLDGSHASAFALLSGSTFTGQIISTLANNTATGGGQIYLNGATGNRIDFNQNGVAAPSFTTRSAGTKINLWPNVGASSTDFAIGIEGSHMWLSVDGSSSGFKWYAGTTNIALLNGTGQLAASSFIPTSSTVPTNGIYLSAANNLSFSTNSIQRVNIDANGAFSITHAADRALQFIRTGTNTFSIEHDASRIYFWNATSSLNAFTILNSGAVGINNNSPGARLQINSSAIGEIGTIIRGFAGQTADLQQWQNNAGTSVGTMSATGAFTAITKSFDIPHPTKENMRLRYGSLEGPENGVYVRGKSKEKTIELPDYWIGLVDEETITVNLTAIGSGTLYVKEIVNNTVIVGGTAKEYFFTVYGERKDVDKLLVEY